MKILCDMTDCIYYIYLPDEGKAYQHQCGNDEIGIGKSDNDEPVCYSCEKKREEFPE